jgi:hypothetical protein
MVEVLSTEPMPAVRHLPIIAGGHMMAVEQWRHCEHVGAKVGLLEECQ